MDLKLQAMDISKTALELTLMLSLPMLLSALVIGLAVSIFQAVTQINEQTLSFIPKMIIIVAVLIFSGPWLVEKMTTYTQELYQNIPVLVKGAQ